MGSQFPAVCLSCTFLAEDSYFSWVYRSWLSRTLLEASFGTLSNKYLAVPNGVGLLQSYRYVSFMILNKLLQFTATTVPYTDNRPQLILVKCLLANLSMRAQ
jgi:hypothetical protein